MTVSGSNHNHQRRPQDWTLGGKAAALFALFSLIMLGGITAFAFLDSLERAKALTRERLHGLTLAAESQVHEFVEAIEHDTLTQMNSVAMLSFQTARSLQATEPGRLRQARADLEATMIAHARSRPYVYQVRLIDVVSGKELIRIQRDPQFGILRTAPLQSKAHRDYVLEMSAMEPGSFYVSDINLNREHGRLEEPHRPTVRFGRVVPGPGGNAALLLVLNVGFRHLEFRLRRLLGAGAELMIFDGLGQVLSHPNRLLPFDFETGPGTTMADLLGVDAARLESQDFGMFNAVMVAEDGDQLVGLRRIRLYSRGDRILILGARRDPGLYLSGLWTLVERSWLLALGFLLIGTLAFGLIGSLMLRPFSRLVAEVDTYEPGLGAPKLGAGLMNRRDEFGVLARGLYGFAMRIEAQMRAARTARDEMRGVFQSAADAIVLIDADALIADANRAAETLFGWTRDELLGRRASSLLIPEDPILSPQRIRGGVEVETHIRPADSGHQSEAVRRDGSRIPVAVSLSQSGVGQGRRYVAIIHDMSHVTALEAARAANMAKSRFLANMSHELRTPLNAVVLHAEMIADEAEDADNAQLIEDAGNIKAAARHLLDLINGILDLARIEAGRTELAPETFELQSFLEELRAMAQALAVAKGNTVQIEKHGLPATVYGDRVKLRQCVLNLISNAAKFTEKGTITLELDYRPNRLLLAVTDTGIGMTQDQQARIFEVFEQAHGYIHGQFGGSGVGLALTRSITDLMGGSIGVNSTLGKGTRFEIIVPLEDKNPQTGVQDRDALASSQGALTLVVDEDDARRSSRVKAMATAGLRVVDAGTLQGAVQQVRLHRPDLLLVETTDAGSDGAASRPSSLVEALQADPDTAGVPMLTMTNGRLPEVLSLTATVRRLQTLGVESSFLQELGTCLGCVTDRVVMVVEDDIAMLRAIGRAIERAALPVALFENGDDVLTYLKGAVPAAVVLDLTLPGANGFDILTVIRNTPRLRHVPVFVATGLDLTADEEHWLKERAEMVVRKGDLDFDTVMNAVVAAVKNNQRHGPQDQARLEPAGGVVSE